MRRVNQQVQNQTILFRIKSLKISNEPFSLLIISLLIIWLIRRWMFLEVEFRRVREWIDWFDWVRGRFGIGRRCSYARVYARSRPTSFIFLLSQVSQRMELKILHHPQNDVSFYGKWRVVLDWRSKSCFEDGVLEIFWGGVVAWKYDSVGSCFWNQCKWLLQSGL